MVMVQMIHSCMNESSRQASRYIHMVGPRMGLGAVAGLTASPLPLFGNAWLATLLYLSFTHTPLMTNTTCQEEALTDENLSHHLGLEV